jgi:hypothetical protein
MGAWPPSRQGVVERRTSALAAYLWTQLIATASYSSSVNAARRLKPHHARARSHAGVGLLWGARQAFVPTSGSN